MKSKWAFMNYDQIHIFFFKYDYNSLIGRYGAYKIIILSNFTGTDFHTQ